MNEYLTSPVTLIVAGVVVVAAIIAFAIKVASNRRKERERLARLARQRAESERRRRLEAERAKPKPKPWDRLTATEREADRNAAESRRVPVRRSASRANRPSTPARISAPAHSRDSDPVYNDTTTALIATGILSDYEPYDSGSRNDSPSYDPSPSPSYDPSPSPSYDSGSSSSSSDGGGFGGGDSGSF